MNTFGKIKKYAFGIILPILCLSVLTACGTNLENPVSTSTEVPADSISPEELADLMPSADPMASTGIIADFSYEILTGVDDFNSIYEQKGYVIIDAEECCKVYICSGQKSSGGYSIRITDISSPKDGQITITVEETSPSPGMSTICVLTYPRCGVTFSSQPSEIIVRDTNGNLFSNLSTDDSFIAVK